MRVIFCGFTWLFLQTMSGTGQPALPSVDLAASPFESGFAQVTSLPSPLKPKRAAPARIVDYDYDGAAGSPLRIHFSDGTTMENRPERGRFGSGDQPITQSAFTAVQMAEDGVHLGWAAEYMICAQSYPCSAEVVILGPGRKLHYIPQGAGIVWEWRFWNGGKQIVVKSGFPHGDRTGRYELFDSDTGRRRAEFNPAEYTPGAGTPPRWVSAIGFNPQE